MTNIKVEHPNGYFGILFGKSIMMIYEKGGHEVLHTSSRNIHTEEELYELLGRMPEMRKKLTEVFKDEFNKE